MHKFSNTQQLEWTKLECPYKSTDLAEGSGLYVFVSEKGECLYFGESISLKRRLINHEHRKLPEARYLLYSLCDDHQRLEREAIERYKPRFNKKFNPDYEQIPLQISA